MDNPADNHWLSEVILRLLEFPSIGVETTPSVIRKIVKGWISGQTYAELSRWCDHNVDDLLEVLCDQIGYRLQDSTAKLCQLAIDSHGDGNISEVARNWSSLLQYGLGSLQQLDLFERGATDRLAVWGVLRFLESRDIDLRGADLVHYLQKHGEVVRAWLDRDSRVPKLCVKRLSEELHLS